MCLSYITSVCLLYNCSLLQLKSHFPLAFTLLLLLRGWRRALHTTLVTVRKYLFKFFFPYQDRLYYPACPITHLSARRGSNRPENAGQMKINECWLVIRWHLLSCSEPSHLYFWPDQVSPFSTRSGAERFPCPPAEFYDRWRLFLGVCLTISSIAV